jgi:hypothetical protein
MHCRAASPRSFFPGTVGSKHYGRRRPYEPDVLCPPLARQHLSSSAGGMSTAPSGSSNSLTRGGQVRASSSGGQLSRTIPKTCEGFLRRNLHTMRPLGNAWQDSEASVPTGSARVRSILTSHCLSDFQDQGCATVLRRRTFDSPPAQYQRFLRGDEFFDGSLV